MAIPIMNRLRKLIRGKGGSVDRVSNIDKGLTALEKLDSGGSDGALINYLNRSITEFTITRDMFPHQYINDPIWEGRTDEYIEEHMFNYRIIGVMYGFAFCECKNLTKINGLDLIYLADDRSFSGCTALTEVELPNALYIGNTAIMDNGVKSVISGSGVKKFSAPKAIIIENGSCSGAASLEYFYIPKITKIGNAFQGCASLKHIYIGADCTQIASACFGGAKSGVIIDCGFAEGAVSGAPWAASNATINYSVPDPGSIDAMIEADNGGA